MATDDKYDRQIRLWGGHGQKILANSNVLLLGANPSGTETLKNLILPAVGRFTVVDGDVVTARDCGNNFFVTQDSIGKPRAEVVTELLKELNPDVEGTAVVQSIEEFVTSQVELIKKHQLIIATDVDNKIVLALSLICEQNEIGLIILRQYGLIGSVRNYKHEVAVIESKPSEVQIDDLRLTNPFPALKDFALNIKFEDLDDMVHAHIPYNVILIQAVEKWRAEHNGNLPSLQAEKDEFRNQIKSRSRDYSKELNFNEAMTNVFKCFSKYELRDSVREIFLDDKINSLTEKSTFWLLAIALARFYDATGVLPLSGKLPDMTATTDFYVNLQNIYYEKAQEDLKAYTQIVHNLFQERGLPGDYISEEEIKLFCSNAQMLEVTRYRSPEKEITLPDYDDLMNEFYDPESVAPWYVVLRATENFRVKNGRYPGQSEQTVDEDVKELRQEVDEIMKKVIPDDSVKIDDKYVKELVRVSDSKVHTVSAFLGGVASQEAIKILIRQYTPLNHTFIYDGINGRCQVFNV